MPTALPVTRGASAALYPFTLLISFNTLVVPLQNGSEKRSIRRPALAAFELKYGAFTRTQKNTFFAAYSSAKGRFDSGLTLTLGSTTFSDLAFADDELVFTESEALQYGGNIRLIQTKAGSWTPGTAGTAFPTLANGAICQLPYSQRKRFQTMAAQMEAGPQYAYAEFGGGLTGFPSGPLMAWDFDERTLSDADLATRIQHFINNWGRGNTFSFTDEDSTVYSKVRYASDSMVVQYNSFNSSSVKTSLVQIN